MRSLHDSPQQFVQVVWRHWRRFHNCAEIQGNYHCDKTHYKVFRNIPIFISIDTCLIPLLLPLACSSGLGLLTSGFKSKWYFFFLEFTKLTQNIYWSIFMNNPSNLTTTFQIILKEIDEEFTEDELDEIIAEVMRQMINLNNNYNSSDWHRQIRHHWLQWICKDYDLILILLNKFSPPYWEFCQVLKYFLEMHPEKFVNFNI